MTTIDIPELPFPLLSDGSPPCAVQMADGEHGGRTLVLTGAAGTDMFVDPSGSGPMVDAGRLVGVPPDGDFTLSARVRVHFATKYDAGALVIHAGQRRWAKLCFELSPQLVPTAVTVVTRDVSDDCNSFEPVGQELWLRITRVGRAWAFHAGEDGQWWRLLRYFALGDIPGEAADPVRVGFLAQSPTGGGCTAEFDHITVGKGAPADLRDGS